MAAFPATAMLEQCRHGFCGMYVHSYLIPNLKLGLTFDCQMIGLYPMTGQTTFLVGSPFFEHLVIDLGSDKKLTITSTGGNRYTAPYVQSLKVNGKSWKQAWVTWDEIFANGGTLDFVLGTNQTLWATGALPPSPASSGTPSGYQ